MVVTFGVKFTWEDAVPMDSAVLAMDQCNRHVQVMTSVKVIVIAFVATAVDE